jgi:hypothetical protein
MILMSDGLSRELRRSRVAIGVETARVLDEVGSHCVPVRVNRDSHHSRRDPSDSGNERRAGVQFDGEYWRLLARQRGDYFPVQHQIYRVTIHGAIVVPFSVDPRALT